MTPVVICFLGTHDLYFFLLQAFLQACRSFIIYQGLAVDSEVVFNQVAKFLVSLPLHATGWTWFFNKHGGVLAPVDMYNRYFSKIKFTCPVFLKQRFIKSQPGINIPSMVLQTPPSGFSWLGISRVLQESWWTRMLCKRSMRKPVTRSCVWFFLVVFCELIAKFLIEMEGMTLAMQKWQSISTSIYFSMQLFFTNNWLDLLQVTTKKVFAVLYKTISDRLLSKSIDSNNGH